MQDRTMIVALIAVVGSFLSYQTMVSWREADAPRVSKSTIEYLNAPPENVVAAQTKGAQANIAKAPTRNPASH